MGLIIVTTGSDLMSGNHVNTSSDYEGTMKLAPVKNLLPDPLLREFDAGTGKHKFWTLGHAPRPTHWAPYVKDNNTLKQFGRQVTGPLPLSTSTVDIIDELVPGPSPQSPNTALPIQSPEKPIVGIFAPATHAGFTAGWYTLAYGWSGDKIQQGEKIGPGSTGPGPKSTPFEMPQGHGMFITGPTDVPEGVTSINYYISGPAADEMAARTGALTLLASFPVTTGGQQQYYKLSGMAVRSAGTTQTEDNTPTAGTPKNPTFIGGRNNLSPIKHWVEGSTTSKHDEPIRVRTAFQFYTKNGKSSKSQPSGWQEVPQGKNKLAFQPESLPREATGWRPMVQYFIGPGVFPPAAGSKEGLSRWYTITKPGARDGFFGRGESAKIVASKPSEMFGGTDYIPDESSVAQSLGISAAVPLHGPTPLSAGSTETPSSGKKKKKGGNSGEEPTQGEEVPVEETEPTEEAPAAEEDQTGVTRPTDTMEVPEIIDLGGSGLTPGKHSVKTSLFVGEEEGPPSLQQTDVSVGLGQAMRVKRPLYHNRLDNSDMVDRNPFIWWPFNWQFPQFQNGAFPANFNIQVPNLGALQLTDRTAAAAEADAIVSAPMYLMPNSDKFTTMLQLKNLDHVSGSVKLLLDEYTDNDTFIKSSHLESFSKTNQDVTRHFELGRGITGFVENITKRALDLAASKLRLRVVPTGTSRCGTRNFDWIFKDWGLFDGWGILRKQTGLDLGRSTELTSAQDKELTFPQGGYCVVRENPTDGPTLIGYPVLDKMDFTSTDMNGWTATTTYPTAMRNLRAQDSATTGDWGYKIEKYAAVAADDGVNHLTKTFTAAASMSLAFDIYINSYSSHEVGLASITDANKLSLATLRLVGDGRLSVAYRDASGALTNLGFIPNVCIDGKQRLSAEIWVRGAGTSTGRITVKLGLGGDKLTQVADFTNLDMTNRQAVGTSIGHIHPVNRAATYLLQYDNVGVSSESHTQVYQDRGNYIEYYGPARTLASPTYGPTGMKVPISPATQYTVSANVRHKAVAAGSSALHVRAMSRDHRVLETYGAVIPSMSGDSVGWRRQGLTFTTHEDAAYIEFFRNNLGAGTVFLHGMQLELGAVASKFDATNQLNGWFNVYINSRQEGIGPTDPAIEVSKIVAIRSAEVYATDYPETSYLVRWRSGNSFAELDAAPYNIDPKAALNIDHSIFECRVDMSSTNENISPEIRGITLDIQRPNSQLCREDGTEYTGGTIARAISAVSAPPRSENIEMASGNIIQAPWGTKRIPRIRFKITAFRRSAVEEILSSKTHTVETPDKRYIVKFEDVPEFEVAPQRRVNVGNNAEWFQMEEADVNAWIVSEVDLG